MHGNYDHTKTDAKHSKSYTKFVHAWNTRVQVEAAKRMQHDDESALVLRLKPPAHLKLHYLSRKSTLDAAEDSQQLAEAAKATHRMLKQQRPTNLRPRRRRR